MFILFLYTDFLKYGAVTGASHLSRPAAAAVLPAGPSSSTPNERSIPVQSSHLYSHGHHATLLFFLREPPSAQITNNNNNNFFSHFFEDESTRVCVHKLHKLHVGGPPCFIDLYPLVYQQARKYNHINQARDLVQLNHS